MLSNLLNILHFHDFTILYFLNYNILQLFCELIYND